MTTARNSESARGCTPKSPSVGSAPLTTLSVFSRGANVVTGALTRTLALFFGKDDMTFTATSDYPQAAQKTRTYARFSDMATDMVNVRIYHGIHFRSADEAAREQGAKVAEWVFGHVAASR